MLDIISRESGVGIKNVAPVPVPLESVLRTIQESSTLEDSDDSHQNVEPVKSAETRTEMIIKQVEFYFSDANLTRDRYMLEHISKDDGFITFEVLAAFPKMKKLSTDFEIIRDALRESTILEMNEQGNKVKRIQPYVPKIKTKKSKSQPNSTNSTPVKEVPIEGKTIYASYIPKGSDKYSIQNIFGIYGNIKRIDIPMDKKTKEIKGIAFLEFETEDQAKRAIDEFNDTENTFYQLGMRVKIYKCRNPKKDENSEKDVSNDNDLLNAQPSGCLSPSSLSIIIPEFDPSVLSKLDITSPTKDNNNSNKKKKKATRTPTPNLTPTSATSDMFDPFESLVSPRKDNSESTTPNSAKQKTPRKQSLTKSQTTPRGGDKTPTKLSLKISDGNESIYEKDISFNYSNSKKKTPTTTPTSEEERQRPRFLFKREELFSNINLSTLVPIRQPKGPLGDGTRGFAAGRGRIILA